MNNEAALAVPDVNVLVALTNPSHVHHRDAHRWLSAAGRFATTPLTESGLVRLLLNPAVVGQAVAGGQAVGLLRALRNHQRAVFLADDTSLASPRVDLAGMSGHRQVPDWHLLNLAARHDAVLVTFDRRLARSAVPTDAERVVVLP